MYGPAMPKLLLTRPAAVCRGSGRNNGETAIGTTSTLAGSRLYARRIAERENSLGVRTRAARSMVRRTVKRNWAARSHGKYSGCSRKLMSCTLTTTGTEQPSGAVY